MTTNPTRPATDTRSGWLPTSVNRPIRVFGWLNFIFQTLIIATGGAVRLTGSGLGCPTWPLCTPDSLVPTSELTWHSAIEFGNRTMTGVLGIVALITVILVWRLRRTRRDLFVLAWIILAGVIVQAVVGGVLVLFDLHPNLVSFHYTISLLLVCVAAAFLVRMNTTPGPRARAVPSWYAILAHVTTLVLAVSVAMGVLTTGAGPHSGDDTVVARNGLNAIVLEHVHAWPGYILFALTIVLLIVAVVRSLPTRRWLVLLLVIELVQIGVGLYQARNGLPALAVGVHMVLAALTAAAMVAVVMNLKRSVSGNA
ncbi:COX15/CtaA family protein [Microbacterium gorillae]|uniref:COX15/CtaA family protein n=1 Tax=Microbacterium gorillae TaxID=1231063 RepID=UPI000B217516|nr:COX15/CtaA family protein [Microbacterium gorillae]